MGRQPGTHVVTRFSKEREERGRKEGREGGREGGRLNQPPRKCIVGNPQLISAQRPEVRKLGEPSLPMFFELGNTWG